MPRRRSNNDVTETQISEPEATEGPSFPMAFHEPMVPSHVSDDAEAAGPSVTVAVQSRIESPDIEQIASQVAESTREALGRVASPLPQAYSPPEPSTGEFVIKSPFVQIVRGQVGIHGLGSIVPVAAFPDLRRLFDLGVVTWAAADSTPTAIDQSAAVAVTLSRPIQLPGSVGMALWAQAAPADIMGPATPRPTRRDLLNAPMPAFETINAVR